VIWLRFVLVAFLVLPAVSLVKGLLRLYRAGLDASVGLQNGLRRSFDREPTFESVSTPW
jgi:hypothetical protein